MRLPGKKQMGLVRIYVAERGRAGTAVIRNVGNWLATPPGMAALTGCQTAVTIINWLGN
ncbi:MULTISPECIES: hypothetical protein [Streptomyces]|uniref:Uncharacterized protein n=1 Tax=Streptomyces caniscabiei TaxID=2746961 RepID=A0A927KZZ9_9ACTN|nr:MULTISPECIES: hypothetical protein [Streptomyces]MBD9701983.1 hypothetical protein [Streptomyces caniscabiei]MBD9722854.1 hypothetical protein [Streptomyces caniscabiei]MBE4738923.1 hypothetical protein [Streptomyces caniscabiei]MBE4757937.1 hypothetical protein [Streptomyces caniscabiei]MBE4787598.1 hypothetical protein [Streptomyces caniscabiei]